MSINLCGKKVHDPKAWCLFIKIIININFQLEIKNQEWPFISRGLTWLWLHGSWIYNYICNQRLSPLMFWVWIWIRARHTTLC